MLILLAYIIDQIKIKIYHHDSACIHNIVVIMISINWMC